MEFGADVRRRGFRSKQEIGGWATGGDMVSSRRILICESAGETVGASGGPLVSGSRSSKALQGLWDGRGSGGWGAVALVVPSCPVRVLPGDGAVPRSAGHREERDESPRVRRLQTWLCSAPTAVPFPQPLRCSVTHTHTHTGTA